MCRGREHCVHLLGRQVIIKRAQTLHQNSELQAIMQSATYPVPPIPISELPNELTTDMDIVSSPELVRLLRQCDSQVFSGYRHHPGLFDPAHVRTITAVSEVVQRFVATDSADKGARAVVMAGSGTSGRLAFLMAHTFNQVMARYGRSPLFKYLCSGGDAALLLSDELPEDDPQLGEDELKKVVDSHTEVLYIGVTCGMSAPFVAGGINFAMHNPKCTTVLIGFSPVVLSRNVKIEAKWRESKTCRDVFMELAELHGDRRFVLNPVVGPEPVQGSTRMKGGTVTKILLETIFAHALSHSLKVPILLADSVPPPSVVSLLSAYESVMRSVYISSSEALAGLVDLGAATLNDPHGHIYIVGSGTLGIMGFIDSSEMPDTYGLDFHRVRAFMDEGWRSLSNVEGDLRELGDLYHMAEDDFVHEIVKTLTPVDSVVFLRRDIDDVKRTGELISLCNAKQCTTAMVTFADARNPVSANDTSLASACKFAMRVPLAQTMLMEGVSSFCDIAAKYVLNAMTTGGNVKSGKVYQNRMVNLGVLNNKLFFRSINTIKEFTQASDVTARECLIRAIHNTDEVPQDLRDMAVEDHIRAACDQANVVPLAILLAAGRLSENTIGGARAHLSKYAMIRDAIDSLLVS